VTAVETKVSRRVLKRYVPVFQERAVDDDLLETGRRNLQEYFQSQGFYDVSVDFMVQPVHDDQETVEYAISRGMRYKLVRVTIAGNRYFDTESIRERMFMQPASFLILRHGRYSEAFQRRDEESIANLYKSNGFRDVKVSSEVTAMWEAGREASAVTIHVDEGSQWVVDDLAIQGATQFKPAELPSLASSTGSRSRK
jgi:outer membrane protein insertion porin family